MQATLGCTADHSITVIAYVRRYVRGRPILT